VEISSLLCPSDGNNRKPIELAPGRTNYRACTGDWSPAGSSTTGSDEFRGIVSGIGVWGKLNLVTDGTSNTILASERNCGGGKPNDLRSVSITFPACFIPIRSFLIRKSALPSKLPAANPLRA
jgi:hypothetical protein